MLYTVVIEYQNDTFLIQERADSPHEAIGQALRCSEEKKIRILNNDEINELLSELESKDEKYSCTPISGLTNTWCTTALVNDKLVQLHVVATSE